MQVENGKLTGGVAISVGGSTEVEVKEKDRVEDALNATRAALLVSDPKKMMSSVESFLVEV